MPESILAIIGGGRWGQVLMSVVAEMSAPFDKVVIVSKANATEIKEKIEKYNSDFNPGFAYCATIDELFEKYHVKAAAVVNAASQHFETARKLINRGAHVLIEKPIVPSILEMQILIEEAARHRACIVPGLNYRFCSYLQNFADEIAKFGIPKNFVLKWSDAANEIRYGRPKKYDASISVVQDVMPHVWTILSTIFQEPKMKMLSCSQNNTSAAIKLTMNNIPGSIFLERNGTHRQRNISLEFASEKLVLDFASEPGIISKNGKEVSADPAWQEKPSPLTRQLDYFFSVVQKGNSTKEDLQYCLGSIAHTELVHSFECTVL